MTQITNLLLLLGLVLTLSVRAQNKPIPPRPLSSYDKQKIYENIVNSTDWDRINEMMTLMSSFPSMAAQYQQQIDAILEQNRYTLNGLVVMQEESLWQQFLQNLEYRQKFGHDPQPTQQSIADAQERQRNGKPPELTPREKMMQQVNESLVQDQKRNSEVVQSDYYHSPEYIADLPNYTGAIDFIREMLEGKRKLSVKDAYYKAEAAFGRLHLTYDEYNSLIKSNADFIRQWLVENKYDLNNPEKVHFGIQEFMSDTLYITVNGKRIKHVPYYYDYIDFQAKDDQRNYFVTKTLATGTGQCHTFPVMYLILAEALGVEAYLAYNPKHSFIRFKNNNGTIISYETTVDRFMGDAFYSMSMPVMATAQKNKIYTYNMTKKQVVASVLYDLAANFIDEHWVSDQQVIKQCVEIAKPYFPEHGYVNGTESHLWKKIYARELNAMVEARNIQSESEMSKYPEITKAYLQYVEYIKKIRALGVQDIPAEEELRLAQYMDTKGKLQTAKGINSKEKRSLFIN
ncbi:MAG: hypothetical protein MUE96_11975 [Bacteroidia bacterium]|jgi:hypothetical protein|nr:hypothetical protein [Bacteroidia bacterium]